MDYIGSKLKWHEGIFKDILNDVLVPHDYEFIDGCSGSGIMSLNALRNGYSVVSNDNMFFPSVIALGQCVLKEDVTEITEHIKTINNISGESGFFHNNYWMKKRYYFTEENTKKIDACRKYIEGVSNKRIKNTLLYLSLEAISRISNTTGVHGAFLKQIKSRAKNAFELNLNLNKVYLTESSIRVKTFVGDIVDLVKKIENKKSVLYFDPPYNQRQYPPNYHLYETFVKNDNPELKGMTGLRKDWGKEAKSQLCCREGLIKAITSIVENSNSEFIYMSYSTDGILSENDISSLLKTFDLEFKISRWKTNRYKSDSKKNREYSKIELFELFIKINKIPQKGECKW